MDFYKVIDEDGLIRIEEPKGSRITVRQEGRHARLLSIYVPVRSRAKGVGATLLSMMEHECAKRGALYMDAGFSDELWDVMSFLTARGYAVSDGPDMMSFETKGLFSKKELKRTLRCSYPDVEFFNI